MCVCMRVQACIPSTPPSFDTCAALTDLHRASHMVEEVEGILLVAAAIQYGRGAGQLQIPINDTLILLQSLVQRLPHLHCPRDILRGS